ncbi:MAG: peptidoglycan editing factor PgeF [Pseudoramibacter sp.]|jgi:YfiH family protein
MQLIRKDPNRPVLRDHTEMIGGLPLRTLTFPMLAQTGCVDHVFTTREGGVSSGDCAAMNFNYDREDDPMVVDANYQRIADAFGGGRSLRHFVCAHQGHTGNVRVVDERDGGEGTLFRRWGKDVDGMVTNTPGLILGVFTADCTPVYLVDPVHRAVGLVHSGWRGTAAGIAANAIDLMRTHFGSDPADLVCAVGPSICRDCYEISEDVATAFRDRFGSRADQILFDPHTRKGAQHWQLDLWQANRLVLENAGVLPEHIQVTDVCTRCNAELLFSHRAAGEHRGNCAAFLSLKLPS